MSKFPVSPPYQTVNPATGEVGETFATAAAAEVEAALTSAQAAYDAWKYVAIEDRATVVHRIAELFVERKDELGAMATREVGQTAERGRG